MAIKTAALMSLLLMTLMFDRPASADGLYYFDFNDVPISKKKKADSAAQIESYMENIYGADVTVGRGVRATNNVGRQAKGMHLGHSETSPFAVLGQAAELPDVFLMSGKGKTPAIVITFGDAPITSFAVDWQLFKKARGLTIKADGEVVFEQSLTKAARKAGMLGHQDPIFFDDPVHTLEFIGWKKSKFAIDNLVVNLPLGDDGSSSDESEGSSGPGPLDDIGDGLLETTAPPQLILTENSDARIESIPEPATLVLLGFGLLLTYLRSPIFSATKGSSPG